MVGVVGYVAAMGSRIQTNLTIRQHMSSSKNGYFP